MSMKQTHIYIEVHLVGGVILYPLLENGLLSNILRSAYNPASLDKHPLPLPTHLLNSSVAVGHRDKLNIWNISLTSPPSEKLYSLVMHNMCWRNLLKCHLLRGRIINRFEPICYNGYNGYNNNKPLEPLKRCGTPLDASETPSGGVRYRLENLWI